jgi:integral membrane sensor domain MASE1
MVTSAARYSLLWFPGYLLLAQLSVRPRWRWLPAVVISVCVPLLMALALSFSARDWVD